MAEGTANERRLIQERIADFARRISGSNVTVSKFLQGARIGSVEEDVVARFGAKKAFGPPQPRFVFTVLIECRFLKSRVPMGKIFALKAVF